MFRKPDVILPLEEDILWAATQLAKSGESTFHGFKMAKSIQAGRDGRLLTGHGTLYRALLRLEKRGLLASDWESPDIATAVGRPLRRLYRLTAEGAAIAARSPSTRVNAAPQARPQAAT